MFLLLYRFVELLAKLSLPLFFSDIVVSGRTNIPPVGPVILIGNHPNMLLDGLVIGSTTGRPISVWAKSGLFKGISGKILRALGVIPVKRRMDISEAKEKTPKLGSYLDNSELQKETFKALKEGRMLALFPEGTSHSEAHILHLKDGISWMILEFYGATNGEIEVPILPCGITYLNKDKWRSQVFIQYAKPFTISKELINKFKIDKKNAVKNLTTELEEVLYSVTLNSEDWETMKLVHVARRIYMDGKIVTLPEYVEVTRRFASVYEKLKDNPEVQKLRNDLKEYQIKLERIHLRDFHVREITTISGALRRVFDRIFYLLILLPLALSGFLINAPILLIGKLSNLSSPHQEVKATVKFMISMLLVPFIYLIYAFSISFFFEKNFFLCLIILICLGTAHVRVLEEEAAVLSSILSSLRVISVIITNSQREELNKLRNIRANLSKRINGLVEKHSRPEDRTFNLDGTESLGSTKRIIPELIRRSSHSDIFL